MPPTEETSVTADASFVKSIKGILLLVEWIFCLIVVICIGAAGWYGAFSYGGFVYFTCVSWLVTAALWYLFYLFGLQTRIGLPWGLMTLIITAVWTIFMFISACLCATIAGRTSGDGNWGSYHTGYAAAAAFAFFSLPVFGYHTFVLFQEAPINIKTSNTNTGASGGSV